MIAASRSFHSAFKVRPEDTQGRQLYTLGDGQWDIPKLRVFLEKILPDLTFRDVIVEESMKTKPIRRAAASVGRRRGQDSCGLRTGLKGNCR